MCRLYSLGGGGLNRLLACLLVWADGWVGALTGWRVVVWGFMYIDILACIYMCMYIYVSTVHMSIS